MPTEFDAAPTKSGRWAKLFGGRQDLSREAIEREAAAEIGAIERPAEEPEQAAEVEASPPHRRRNTWSRFRQVLSDEPADVRRERLEREAADELGLSR